MITAAWYKDYGRVNVRDVMEVEFPEALLKLDIGGAMPANFKYGGTFIVCRAKKLSSWAAPITD
jgi:hypothetical protein